VPNQVSPTYDEVMADAQSIARSSSGLAKIEDVGKSEEGRGIPLLTLTDPAVPDRDKVVAFFTGGTHGSEEAGRAITLGLARWLLEPQNRSHLQKQVILIIPCVNPDGAIRNIYHNARDVNVYKSNPLWEQPLTAEGRTVWEVARQWLPDAYVDCHGLAGGAMGDSEYIHHGYGPDFNIACAVHVTSEMNHAACLAGYPQRVPHFMVIRDEGKDSLPSKFAWELHSFSLTVETTENYYPIEETIRSGLARLSKLIEIGERVHFFQPYPNYPCDVITGNEMGALMPYGPDYAARRKNRALSARMIREGVPNFARGAADKGGVAHITTTLEPSVTTRPSGIAVQLAIDRRAQVRDVKWNGKPRPQTSSGDGWRSWMNELGLVVRAEIGEPPVIGANSLEVSYQVPFKPHVELP
jgi:hypothetical protein